MTKCRNPPTRSPKSQPILLSLNSNHRQTLNKDFVNSEQSIEWDKSFQFLLLMIRKAKCRPLFQAPICNFQLSFVVIPQEDLTSAPILAKITHKKRDSVFKMSSNPRSETVASRAAAGSAAQAPTPVVGEHYCTHAEPFPLGQTPREFPSRGILPLYQTHKISEVLTPKPPKDVQ